MTTGSVRLGKQLRRLRLAQGLSQRGLARALGLSAHSNLVQYELGRRIPPGDIIAACERLLRDDSGTLRRLRAEALAERAGSPEDSEPQPLSHGDNIPAMLPASVADFTGRAAQLRRLATLCAPGEAQAVVVTVITGTAGVGKTALAVRFAHQVRGRYPDGQLYINLGGYGPGAPVTALQALANLLHGLGVPPDQVPVDVERAAGLYRSRCAGKRLLVVLDNAHRAEQVRPLLPGEPGSLVLVTSRDRLSGLIAHDGARRLTLEVLSPVESGALLARIAGRSRVAAEPEAATDLAELCAHLPLALRIAAANLADQPHRTITSYAAQLRAEDRLDVLAVNGDKRSVVRAALSASYTRLPGPARRMFRLFGLVPADSATVAALCALAGVTQERTLALLERLTAAHLLTESAPGRYTCHDLLRQYAADRARREESDVDRAAAVNRWYGWYLTCVHAAADLLYPTSARVPLPARWAAAPPGFADGAQALAWLRAEQSNMVRAVQDGPPDAVWRLADALRGYFWLSLDVVDWFAVAEAGARAAQEPLARAAAQLNLADAHGCLGNHETALEQYHGVLAFSRDTGWVPGESAVLNSLGRVYWQLDRLEPAAAHLAEALEIDRRTGSLSGQAVRLANLGAIHHEMGRLPQAADYFEGALDLARRTGQRRGEAICLANLALTRHEMGTSHDVTDMLEQALATAREVGDAGNESHAQRVLALVHSDRGEHRRALQLAHAAVDVATSITDPNYRMETLTTLADVLTRRGELAVAHEHYCAALKLARQTRCRYPQIMVLIGLVNVYIGQDRPVDALDSGREACDLARESGYRVLEGNALDALARAHEALGHTDEAASCRAGAAAVHTETGFRARS